MNFIDLITILPVFTTFIIADRGGTLFKVVAIVKVLRVLRVLRLYRLFYTNDPDQSK